MAHSFVSFALAACLFLAAGCTSRTPVEAGLIAEDVVVRSGESYGECTAFCFRILEIEAAQTLFVKGGGQDAREHHERPTDPARRQQVLALVDLDAFALLPEVIGADPRIFDGAVEWIEIEQAGFSKRVSFPVAAPPPQLDELAAALRTWRDDLDAPAH